MKYKKSEINKKIKEIKLFIVIDRQRFKQTNVNFRMKKMRNTAERASHKSI